MCFTEISEIPPGIKALTNYETPKSPTALKTCSSAVVLILIFKKKDKDKGSGMKGCDEWTCCSQSHYLLCCLSLIKGAIFIRPNFWGSILSLIESNINWSAAPRLAGLTEPLAVPLEYKSRDPNKLPTPIEEGICWNKNQKNNCHVYQKLQQHNHAFKSHFSNF